MSDQSLHLAKWMVAPEQVTLMHLVKSNAYQIFIFSEGHLAKWHIAALSQVITHTDEGKG